VARCGARTLRAFSQAPLADAPNVITLHLGVLADYWRKLERLQEAIEQDIRDHAPRYSRSCGACHVRHDTNAPQGVHIEVTGRLNSLLRDKAFPNRVGGIGGSGGAIPSITPRQIPLETVYLFDAA
jgi:hypothetical protein